MGVAAVNETVLVVSLTPRLPPMIDVVQLPPAEALLMFGTSVPAVAVQLSPTIGLLEQKSISTSGWVIDVAGVKVTWYETLVALGDESLISILLVVTWPANAVSVKSGNAPTAAMARAITAYAHRANR